MSNVLLRTCRCSVLIVISVVPRITAAQSQDVPPPKPPFVSTLPDSVSWKMVFSKPKRAQDAKSSVEAGKQAKAPADPTKEAAGDVYVRMLEVTKSADVRREVTTWSNNSVTEAWVVGNTNVAEDRSKQMVIRSTSSYNHPQPDAMQEFPLLEWIELQNYKGVEIVGGKKCYFFKQTSPLTEVTAGYLALVPGMSSQMSAYIEVETGLPAAAQVNEVTVSYTFGPGSTSPLTLPDRFQQAIAQHRDGMWRLTHLPSPP